MYASIVEQARSDEQGAGLPESAIDELISLALGYIEPRHRLGLVTPELEQRILRARQSFRDYLPQEYVDEIEFYDPNAAGGSFGAFGGTALNLTVARMDHTCTLLDDGNDVAVLDDFSLALANHYEKLTKLRVAT